MDMRELFEGYEFAHGTYIVRGANDRGKMEGKALTLKGGATEQDWKLHLSGNGPGLGIIPLLSDDTVVWGCIDIDIIGIDLKALETKCRQFSFPLVICRSKSGGAHAFLFFSERVPAVKAINALTTWASVLGYGGCEIFPKQSTRYNEEDIGNWLNMPYFYAERTNRYCLHDGEELDIDQFLEFAYSMRQTEAYLDNLPQGDRLDGKDLNEGLFEEGPPCLQIIHAQGGLPDGTRNEGMYNVAVYLRKRFPDKWKDHLQEYNLAMCDPPLSLSDINTIAKSVDKKAYDYRCKKPPIQSHCNRKLCYKREWGVGEGASSPGRPEVLEMKKIIGNPTIVYVTINGTRVKFEHDEFIVQPAFQKKVHEMVNIMPPPLPPDRWVRFINDISQNADIEEAPHDVTEAGHFESLFYSYVTGLAKNQTVETFVTSMYPLRTEEGEVWFRYDGLVKFLGQQNYKIKSNTGIAELLKSPPFHAKSSTVDVKGKRHRIWKMKAPDISTIDTSAVKVRSDDDFDITAF